MAFLKRSTHLPPPNFKLNHHLNKRKLFQQAKFELQSTVQQLKYQLQSLSQDKGGLENLIQSTNASRIGKQQKKKMLKEMRGLYDLKIPWLSVS